VTRVDHNFGEKDKIFADFFSDSFFYGGYLDPANFLTYTGQSNISYRSSHISETHIFTSQLMNTLIVKLHAGDSAA